MRKVLFGLITLLVIFFIIGCGKTYVCRKCDKAVSNIYYDIDGDIAYCKDCARDYWAPLDYEDYRVKD